MDNFIEISEYKRHIYNCIVRMLTDYDRLLEIYANNRSDQEIKNNVQQILNKWDEIDILPNTNNHVLHKPNMNSEITEYYIFLEC
jgi:hypothetical protein